MKKPEDKKLFARMNPNEAKKIEKRCRENDETVSQRIRKLLRLWMEHEENIFEK